MDQREPEPYADEPDVPLAAPDDVAPESAEPPGRRYPSTLGGAVYLLVLAASTAGLGITARGNWRLGVKWVAVSLLAAAVVRLLLPAKDAGMLAVRRRTVDVVLLVVVGIGLFVLATTIPNQPPL